MRLLGSLPGNLCCHTHTHTHTPHNREKGGNLNRFETSPSSPSAGVLPEGSPKAYPVGSCCPVSSSPETMLNTGEGWGLQIHNHVNGVASVSYLSMRLSENPKASPSRPQVSYLRLTYYLGLGSKPSQQNLISRTQVYKNPGQGSRHLSSTAMHNQRQANPKVLLASQASELPGQ